MNIKKITTLTIILLTLLTHTSTAQLTLDDIQIKPNIIWLHEGTKTLTLSAACKYNGEPTTIATVTAYIYPLRSGIPSVNQMSYDANKEKYTLTDMTFPFSEPGIYDINITCVWNEESTSKTARIYAQKLELEVLKDSEILNAYIGDYLTLKVAFTVDDGSGSRIIPPPQGGYSLKIGTDFKKNNIDPKDIKIIGGQYQSITVELPQEPTETNYLREGIYNLEITGTYTVYGEKTSITKNEKSYIKINPALKTNLPSDTIQCILNEACKKEIDVGVIFPVGDIEDFSTENFEAIVLGKQANGAKAYIKKASCNKKTNTCKLEVDVPPTLPAGEYELYITTAYPAISNYDYISKTSLPLSVVLQLSGEMKDAAGNVVDTKITLENKKTGEITTTTTDSNGLYSINLLPGTYDISARFFGGVNVKFKNVELNTDTSSLNYNFLKYDRDAINSKGPGTKPIKIVVVEFALPFENVWMNIPYDSSKVNGDEEQLTVHNCNKWNFKKRSCSGEWVEISREIHTIQDTLEYTTNTTGAFVIGEKRLMHITDVDVRTEKVYINEPVNVIGKVVDADGSPVEDMEVIVSFPRFNISQKTLSKTGGLFGAEVMAPYADGPVDMMISVANSMFSAGNYTKTIDVLRKRELSITGLSDMIDVKINEEKTIRFIIINSGQTNLTKTIRVNAKGISTDWYRILPININGIPPGESRNIEMKIKMTPELCGGACPPFSLVTVEAYSDEISTSTSFTLRLQQPETQSNTTKTTIMEGDIHAGGDLFKIPSVTGLAVSIPNITFDGTYLYLTVIVVLLILIVNKKKSGRRRGVRAPVVASLHRIKTGI